MSPQLAPLNVTLLAVFVARFFVLGFFIINIVSIYRIITNKDKIMPLKDDSQKPQYFTAVFEINDPDKFNKEMKSILIDGVKKEGEQAPYCVSAMSIQDEISRIDLITEAIQEGEGDAETIELITLIVSSTGNYHDLGDFKKQVLQYSK